MPVVAALPFGGATPITWLTPGQTATVLACQRHDYGTALKIRTSEGIVGFVESGGTRLQRRPATAITSDPVTSCGGLFPRNSEYFP